MADYCEINTLAGTAELNGYIDPKDDATTAQFEEMITRASRRIDAYVTDNTLTDYFAPSPAEPSVKKLRGRDVSFLQLPLHVAESVTAVTVSEPFTVPDFAYETDRLVCVDQYGIRTRRIRFAEGVPYSVTARWGFAAVPGEIKEACLQLVVRTFRAKDDGFSGVIGAIKRDGSMIERALPAPVKDILDGHRNKYRRQFYFA
ncbi:MAG TPA: hypothetical protein VF556_08600 [Pyrinomonadaceae bacterium]|jgi:hypothetical protein